MEIASGGLAMYLPYVYTQQVNDIADVRTIRPEKGIAIEFKEI